MKMIVTGANGFVGSYLLQTLSAAGNEILAIVRSNKSNVEKIKKIRNVKIFVCDLDCIEQLPNIISERNIDCCIHLAWEGATGIKRGDYNIQLKNIYRTLNLCRVLKKMNIKRFVGIGTLAEKDVNNYIPTDGATPNLVSCYGTAKLSAQYMSKAICSDLGIEHVWCQLSNIYGIGDETNNFINFASKLMLCGERPSFTSGEQMYDFVYVSDIAEGIYAAAKKGEKNTVYYIGSGNPQILKNFIIQIRDCINQNIHLYLGEKKFNGVCLPDREFDCSKLINDTGYLAKISFEEGIKMTIDWLKTKAEEKNGKN